MTKYACPHCDGHINAGPEWAGAKIHCPHCSKLIDLPRIAPSVPGDPPTGHPGHPGQQPLYTHRLIRYGLPQSLRPPDEWRVFHRMLIGWLLLGAIGTGLALYVNRASPNLVLLGVVCAVAMLIVGCEALCVKRPWTESPHPGDCFTCNNLRVFDPIKHTEA